MKLTKFEELWSAVNNFELDRIAQTEVKIFNEVGLDTDLDDIFLLDNNMLVTVLKDGTVRKTIVYISEIKEWILNEYHNLPKFHIFNCRTLVQMKNQNRSYRYKKTLRSDGKFFMVITNTYAFLSKKTFLELEICGNCLRTYNSKYKKFYKKNNFDIKEYIKQPIDIKSNTLNYLYFQDDLETVPRFYAKNWNEISKELKKLKNYTCEKCGINLEFAKQYLHTHHIDSNPSNNVVSNLKVLCIECHSNEFNHSHIKNNYLYKEFLLYKQRN